MRRIILRWLFGKNFVDYEELVIRYNELVDKYNELLKTGKDTINTAQKVNDDAKEIIDHAGKVNSKAHALLRRYTSILAENIELKKELGKISEEEENETE